LVFMSLSLFAFIFCHSNLHCSSWLELHCASSNKWRRLLTTKLLDEWLFFKGAWRV
jgi:hypothetical protein